jgi:spore germination cell wall hydrolase CwlJ-like protein
VALSLNPGVTPQSIATALKYGPSTGYAIQRSQYLADALKNIQDTSQSIQSAPELGVKLLATALLSRRAQGADRDALAALTADRQAQTDDLLRGLPTGDGGLVNTSGLPATGTTPPIAPNQQPSPSATAAPSRFSDQDKDALARMIYGEASGEGDQGMTAAGAVAMNRLNKGYGGAKTLADVVNQPHQFEAMNRADVRNLQPANPAYQKAQMIASALMDGQAQDPTGGAMNFINPDLQSKLGRPQPAWAPAGQGQRIGNHVFYGGTGQPTPLQSLAALGSANPPGGPQLGAGAGQGGVGVGQPLVGGQEAQAPQLPLNGGQSFQVASNGPTPMPAQGPSPQQPSPAMSPLGPGGSPSAAVSPAAGGSASQVTPQEAAFAKRLLSNPQTFEQGQAYALKLQERQAAGPRYDVQVVNGVAYRIDPQTGQAVQVQTPGSRESVKSAQDLGIPAPPGTMFNVDPNGKATALYQPPQGFQSAPGGAQAYVPGGPQDPAQGMNRLQGLKELRGEVAPTIALATSLRRNYSALQTGYQQQNGAGDIAMMNGLQKMIDEGVVREGDINTQMHAQGLDGTLGSWMQYVKSGGVFTPQVRNQLLHTGDSLYGNINQTYKDRVFGYRKTADENYGAGSFEQVLPPETISTLGWADKPQGGGARPGGAPPQPSHTPMGFTQAQAAKAQEIVKNPAHKAAKPGDQLNPFAPRDQAAYKAIPPGSWFIDDDGTLVRKGGK